MLEQKVDILSREVLDSADAICFTSNGVLKKNGHLVMGAGVAKAFRDTFKGIAQSAGRSVKTNGNICQVLGFSTSYSIVAFPTKNHWRDPSDMELIERSARQLVTLANELGWQKVYLPRPGCRNGGLNWEKQVKPLLETILDDRIIVVSK